MAAQRTLMIKPAFLTDIQALSPKEVQQIMAKINMLCQDPLPDGKVKKHLTHLQGRPYRILYKFDAASVNVLTVRKRDEGCARMGTFLPAPDSAGQAATRADHRRTAQ